MKKVKSAISIVLCIALTVLASPISVMAASNQNEAIQTSQLLNSVNEDVRETAVTDIKVLNDLNLPNTALVDITTEDDQLQYTYDLGTVLSVIIPTYSDDGVTYKITEEGLSNTVFFSNAGDIYLDGKLISAEKTLYPSTEQEQKIQPRVNYFEDFYTDVCPYGTNSSYSSYVGMTSSGNVDMQQKWLNITVSAALLIFAAFIPPLAGLAVGAFSIIITNLKDKNPTSTSASFYDYSYTLPGGVVLPVPIQGYAASYVTQHDLYLYSLPSWQGNATQVYSYYCHNIQL